MAERGRARNRRGAGRGERSSPRRPERARRDDRKSRVRQGLRATRASSAAKVLGMSTTRRAAFVAIVVCALAFTIAVPLRTYLAQKTEVSQQQARQVELRKQVDELERRKADLSDPTQVEAEARRRLRYVMPGETPYMVELPGDDRGDGDRQADRRPQLRGTWYERLWDSVESSE